VPTDSVVQQVAMIIRLLDDSKMPEDKVVMSVPDPSKPVKQFLVVIKQKLELDQKMDAYTIWHVANRKVDRTRRPVDPEKSWTDNGVVDKGFIYVKEKAEGDDAAPEAGGDGAVPPPPPPPPPRPPTTSLPSSAARTPAVTNVTAALPPPRPTGVSTLPATPVHSQVADTTAVPPPPNRTVPTTSTLSGDTLAAKADFWSRFNTSPSPEHDSGAPAWAPSSQAPLPHGGPGSATFGSGGYGMRPLQAPVRAMPTAKANFDYSPQQGTDSMEPSPTRNAPAERQDQRLAALEAEVEMLKVKLEERDARIATLQSDLMAETRRAVADRATLEATCQALREDVSRLRVESGTASARVKELETINSNHETALREASNRTQFKAAVPEALLAGLNDDVRKAATDHMRSLNAEVERKRQQVADTLSLYHYAHNNVETMRARALLERERIEQRSMLAQHRATIEATVHSALANATRGPLETRSTAARWGGPTQPASPSDGGWRHR
jgi:hypothetical protein